MENQPTVSNGSSSTKPMTHGSSQNWPIDVASCIIRDLDPGTLATARQVATDAGTSLDDVLRVYIASYSLRNTAGQAGGRARADALSPARRRSIAQHAARTRWGHR